MDDKLYEYATDRITVRWSRVRCTHAADCVRGLPRVFDPVRRPWGDPALARVIVVNTCSFIRAAADESIDTILALSRLKRAGRCRR